MIRASMPRISTPIENGDLDCQIAVFGEIAPVAYSVVRFL
jgi:hypothetical protein